jgi:NhaP-type Na+/H+ or K+/H+ antiporter
MTTTARPSADSRPKPARVLSGPWLTFLLAGAALIGFLIARQFGVHAFYRSPGYLYAVTALLAIGIYSSTSGIDLSELRNRFRTVILAITVGVLAKSVLIAAFMLPLLHDPVFAIVLGVAVAQIDPLAVAALIGQSRMSESGKTIIRAWSSFDDPVTMLLTIYLLVFVPAANGTHLIGSVSVGTRPIAIAVSIALNLAFAGGLFVTWRIVRLLRRRHPAVASSRWARFAMAAFLLAVGYIAVTYFLLFGLALVGLFWRPTAQAALDRTAKVALVLASVALGLVFVDGIRWIAGLVLGCATYLAQFLVAPIVAISQRGDRMYLALGQQNGITAITLALLLQPFYSDAVAIIGPAVLVVNLLHAGSNAAWNRVVDRRVERASVPDGQAPVVTGTPRPIAAPLTERASSGAPTSPWFETGCVADSPAASASSPPRY